VIVRARVMAVVVVAALILTAAGALFMGIVMAMSTGSPASHPSPPSGQEGPCNGLPTDAAKPCDQGWDTVYIVGCWVLKVACGV
jgi:hypothetical protein